MGEELICEGEVAMITRFFKGLGALIVLVAVLVGIPTFLILVVGNPFPTPAELVQQDYGNMVLLTKILPIVAWVAWALFAIPWFYELIMRLFGRKTAKRIWITRGQQQAAAGLIAAVAIMFVSTTSLASPARAMAAEPAVTHVAAAPVADTQRLTESQAAPAVSTQAPQRSDLSYVVQSGDNLWDIAAEHLGDGAKYPEIVAASQHIVQPGGRYLSDPDVIDVGWTVIVPGAGPLLPATPAPAPTGPAESAPSTSGASGGSASNTGAGHSATGSTVGSAAPEQSRPEARHAAPSEHNAPAAHTEGSNVAIPLMTAGGIGALLAAGLVVALGRRRLRQRRRRAAGERIAMPDAAAADFETQLRTVQATKQLEIINNALRALQVWAEDTDSPLPKLLAVRIEREPGIPDPASPHDVIDHGLAEIALYLLEPAQLPAPFAPADESGVVWLIPPSAVVPPIRSAVSPYPALVSIGTDPNRGTVLVDLEQIGALNITGNDTNVVTGMLNAMAVELTATPWSEGIELTLVGMPIGIAKSVDRYKVQHVEDVAALVRNLRADLEDRAEALASYGATDVHEGRVKAAEYEGWAPHIVLLASEPPAEIREELDELVAATPHLGIATVASSSAVDDGARIVVSSQSEADYYDADGKIPQLPFAPQILAGNELEQLEELFRVTEHESHPADLVMERHPIPAEPVGEHAEHDEFDELLDAGTSYPDGTWPTDEGSPATKIETAADLTPAEPEPAEPVDAADSSSQLEDELAGTVPSWPAPYIRLLGPIDAINVDLTGAPARTIELLAYLNLIDGNPSGVQIQDAFYKDRYDPTADNIRTLVQRVRKILGAAPDGTPILPSARKGHGYSHHPALRTDWQDFCELIGDDVSRTSDTNLVAAVRLVRGKPFEGADNRRGWWVWQGHRERMEQDMTAAILDAAEELSSRALMRGDIAEARTAALAAKVADPVNEAGWRMEMRAALAAKDRQEFGRVRDAMLQACGGGDLDYELDEATQDLVDAGETGLASA
jgi:DNA-binding SARP family transcriptional activator